MSILPEVNCEVCDHSFDPDGYWDEEYHDGYGTRREWFPTDGDIVCGDCKGQGRCEELVKVRAGTKWEKIEPCGKTGRTRFCAEDNDGKTRVGVYCDDCAKPYVGQEDGYID